MAMKCSMELIPANADQLDKIFKEINLRMDQHKKDTQDLRNWLVNQPHLPHDIDECMLASFIVGCKNSMERSKRILDAYLTNRTSCPDFYQSRDPCDSTFQRQCKLVQFFMLPQMTPEGYRVSIFHLKSPDVSPEDFNLRTNAIKVLSSYDVRLLEENYWAGDVMILDCENVGFKHVQGLASLPILKKYVHCANESLPVRFKKIIFINLPPAMIPFISMIKKLLKQKFLQRTITSTEDYSFLHKHLPKDILPDEYGGKAGSIDDLNDAWHLKVESYRDWFLRDMNRKVDESKRPGRSTYESKNMFGIEGSFKTLMID